MLYYMYSNDKEMRFHWRIKMDPLATLYEMQDRERFMEQCDEMWTGEDYINWDPDWISEERSSADQIECDMENRQ